MSKPAAAIVHVPALVAPVKKIVAAFTQAEKAQNKLGNTVLEVAPTLKADNIEPFCAMLKAQLESAYPEKAGSIKAQITYIRRVVTAIVVDGVTPEPGQSLRGLYDSLPKKETGGNAHASKRGAQLPNPADSEGEPSPAATLESRADKVRGAVTMIFGYQEPELLDAVQFAAANVQDFIRWAQKAAQDAALAELEKAVTAAPAKAPAKVARKRKVVAAD